MTLGEEVRGMLSKARRYIESADTLRQMRDYDSAISRLYYSMFDGAEAVLLVRGLTFSSHRAVLSAFAQHFVKPGLLPKDLHQWLREAFDKRQISDYEFHTDLSDDEVLDLKNKAEQFLLQIEAFLKCPGEGL